ncbi:NAD(P)/FAD-dependent oxidoreductase [Microbacterium paraoxydans]|uniref:NAD(P)/FAD-dependent oxidoreductase n=1 Tax=Microbacterium paraoxydans TaxID=199592 RepID=UPI0030136B73
MDDNAARTADIVVVGAGVAAHRFVARMVEDPDRAVRITVFGDEGRLPYDRSVVARVVGGAAPSAGELERAPFRDDRVRLIDDDRILRIDRGGHRVRTRSQRWYDYDALVLATGTHAHRLDVPGIRGRGAFSLRTMEDAHRLRAFLAVRATEVPRALRAIVVGGDEAGVDAACALHDAGVQTTMVDTADRLLPAHLNVSAATALRSIVEARGIAVRMRTRVTRVDPDATGAVTAVEFQDGTFARTDLIVTTGARARDELARNAGLPTRAEGGVLVDAGGRTADPRVLAIGDVAADAGAGGTEAALASADRAAAALIGARVASPAGHRWRGNPGGIEIVTLRLADGDGPTVDVPLPTREDRVYGEVVVSEDARVVHCMTVIGGPAYTPLAHLAPETLDDREAAQALLVAAVAEDGAEPCGHSLLSASGGMLAAQLIDRGIRTFAQALDGAVESRACGPCRRRLALALRERAEADVDDGAGDHRSPRSEVRLRGTTAAPVLEVRIGAEADPALLLVVGRLAARRDATVRIDRGLLAVGGLPAEDMPDALEDLRSAGAVVPETPIGGAEPVRPGVPVGVVRQSQRRGRRERGRAGGARSAEGSA